MAHHNLHFTDREAAINWASNYGGKFHDNMHSRGDDRGTNFTVTEEWDDEGSCEYKPTLPETIFINDSVVYHPVYGRGVVIRPHDNCNTWIVVQFITEVEFNPDYDKDYPVNKYIYHTSWVNFDIKGNNDNSGILKVLSFKPWSFQKGGWTQDVAHRVLSPQIHGCREYNPKPLNELEF